MAGLMDRAEQRKSLKRAGDADTDPASISASENTVENTSDKAGIDDSGNDSDTPSDHTSDYDMWNAGGKASDTDGGNAADKAGSPAGLSHSDPDSRNARDNTGGDASEPTRRNTTTETPRRGPGRPPGPERRPITVRVLAEHDQVLTDAWDEDGLRPQQVLDEALADWAKKRKRKRNRS